MTPANRMADCKRCDSYARRLDELNQDFNKLWDYLLSIGHDPEKALSAKGKPCVCQVDDSLVQEWVSKAREVAKVKGFSCSQQSQSRCKRKARAN